MFEWCDDVRAGERGALIVGPGPPPKPKPTKSTDSEDLTSSARMSPDEERAARIIRRDELGSFLRTRRAAVTPADVGLTVKGHRKTPGLRREEVSQLAGVGLSWYTWLEQARDITPSVQVLGSIGRALRLDQTQTDHLFHLAGLDIPSTSTRPTDALAFDEIARALLPHAAYVLNSRFDVVAFNVNAELFLGDLAHREPGQRNFLRWLFGVPHPFPDFLEAWALTARANLLDFRVEYARHAGDPWYEQLVAELRGQNAQFRTWWDEHDVEVIEPNHRRIPHITHGALQGFFFESHPVHQPEHRLRIIVASDETTRSIFAENQGPIT